MNIARLSVLALSLLLTACGATRGSLPAVSQERTTDFVRNFEATSDSDYQRLKEYQDTYSTNPEGKTIKWIQPANKDIPCKIYAVQPKGGSPWWDNPDNRVYWDGACKGGYAYGVGREFLYQNQSLGSWLGEYPGGERAPAYYLYVFYDKKEINFVASSPPYMATLGYKIQQTPMANEISVMYHFTDFSERRLYFKSMRIGGDAISWSMVLPNNNAYIIRNDVNSDRNFLTFYTQDAKKERVGYSLENLSEPANRQVRHIEYLTQSQTVDVLLPQSYLDYITTVSNKINRGLEVGNKLLQESYAAVNKYKRMICVGKVSVTFVDDEIYGRICLQDGELSPYTDLIAQLQSQQKTRHEVAHQQFVRQQDANAQQQYAREQQARQNSNAMAQSVNDFSRSMSELNQNAAQTAQSYIGAIQSPGSGSWGGQNNIQTNCIRISNMVNCRSQ